MKPVMGTTSQGMMGWHEPNQLCHGCMTMVNSLALVTPIAI